METDLSSHARADKIKWIVTFIVILGLIGAVIGLSVSLSRSTAEEIGGEAYSIGIIQETGEVNTKEQTSIYTRKDLPVDGLRCSLKMDAKITYRIFFYDKEGKFLSATSTLSTDYDGTGVPAKAETAKIMITPVEDEDGKVSLVEILGYANQLTVVINR